MLERPHETNREKSALFCRNNVGNNTPISPGMTMAIWSREEFPRRTSDETAEREDAESGPRIGELTARWDVATDAVPGAEESDRVDLRRLSQQIRGGEAVPVDTARAHSSGWTEPGSAGTSPPGSTRA